MQLKNKRNRTVAIKKTDGSDHKLHIYSMRNDDHLIKLAEILAGDKPIAFHGWGVSGVGKRVDKAADHSFFWICKKGRPLTSKIPLLEMPEAAINLVDWEAVHSKYQFLKNPNKFRRLWKARYPFHLILPYKESSGILSEASITPAFDPVTAPDVPFPTFCLFWVEDPDLIDFVKLIKSRYSTALIGVTSLNDAKETPPFNSKELVDYLMLKQISFFEIIAGDPLMEELDIASSHTQISIPLKGQKPVWIVKRRGSLSPEIFQKQTGFPIYVPDEVRVATMKSRTFEELDKIMGQAAKALRERHKEKNKNKV